MASRLVYTGGKHVDSFVHYYHSVGGLLAAEVMFVDADGKIARVVAHYGAAP